MCFRRTPPFPLPLANFTHQDSFTSVQKPRLPLQVHLLPSCPKSPHGALDQIPPQPHPALCSSPPRLPQSCSSCSLSLSSGPWQQATPVTGLRSSPPPWSTPDPALIPLRSGPKAVPRRGAPASHPMGPADPSLVTFCMQRLTGKETKKPSATKEALSQPSQLIQTRGSALQRFTPDLLWRRGFQAPSSTVETPGRAPNLL